jgi:hypothetical protein
MSRPHPEDRPEVGPVVVARPLGASRPAEIVLTALVVVTCVLLRLGLIDRQGLWADELFSLAMATGHSLEHPAAVADPARGDFVELPRPSSPAAYARYLEHDRPPAGPSRVVRAVLLSDTSPPLYYLLLSAWTRLLGTSDAALRSFSVLWALCCLPPLAALARHVAGRRAVLPELALFSFAPACVYYSTEGRMYSLWVFLTISTAWLTLQWHRRGATAARVSFWVAASAAGLLTHYFYALPWLAFFTWLLAFPGRSRRRTVLGAAMAVAFLALPWYLNLPESLGNWRVTQDWLKDPSLRKPWSSAPRLVWSYMSAGGGGKRNLLSAAVLAPMIALIAWRGGPWFSTRRLLLWSWLAAALLEPALFDLLRGTGTMSVPRYVLSGMPAAYLLLASGLGRLRRPAGLALLLLLAMPWLVGIDRLYRSESRIAPEPFRQIGRDLAGRADRSCLVIVHSIPSGVAGIARYMEADRASAEEIGFAAWVGQLKRRRVPEDLRALAAGRRRIIIVNLHAVGEPAPEEDWLREHAMLDRSTSRGAAEIREFIPRDAATFFESVPPGNHPDRSPTDGDG